VIVGGDGSIHEVLNGMLHRSDKKRLPVALVPNGTGNDLSHSFLLRDIDMALNYIVKAQTIRMDCIKVTLDYENESEIPEELDKLKYSKYCIMHTGFNLPA